MATKNIAFRLSHSIPRSTRINHNLRTRSLHQRLILRTMSSSSTTPYPSRDRIADIFSYLAKGDSQKFFSESVSPDVDWTVMVRLLPFFFSFESHMTDWRNDEGYTSLRRPLHQALRLSDCNVRTSGKDYEAARHSARGAKCRGRRRAGVGDGGAGD